MGFKRFDPEDLVVSNDSITATVWSNNVPSLGTFYTSSTQTTSNTGQYYYHVYQTASSDASAAVQFDIAYCDSKGSGSQFFNPQVVGNSPTRTNYGQYRSLVLGDENANFIFGNHTGSDFYALSIERARYKEKLLPGSFNLVLSSSNPGLSELHLTDNSNLVTLPTYYGTQRAYQVISGSDGTSYDGGTGYTEASGSYGLYLPDISTVILNADALDDNSSIGINLGTIVTTGSNSENLTKLFNHISGSGGDDNGNIFKLNSQETLTSDFVFVRARNSEFNYSENPSFISGSTGEVIYPYFINNPQSFATTVGMYNDSNELLAVAKLSKPLVKDFTKEALIRVKLDF